MYSLVLSLLLLILSACGNYGSHSHYIISQDEVVAPSEEAEEVR